MNDLFLSLSLDVTAIIFVIACSSFNMVIREDQKTVSCFDLTWEGESIGRAG